MSTASPAFSELKRHDDLTIPVGVESVAATRYEPTAYDGPLPVVLMAIPYRKDDRITYGSYFPSLSYIARRGYEVVVADLIGTGASTGTKSVGFDDVGEEVATVVEWLARQEWCTGDVGMYGKSYGALTQLQAAARDPPSLKAIVPVEISASMFEMIWPGGVFDSLRIPTWSTQMHAFQALPPSRRDNDGEWAAIWERRLDDLREETPWLFQQWSHDERDDYWNRQEVAVENVAVPALVVGGYRDIHTSQIVDYFDAIDAPKRLLLGPWRHTIPHRGRESAIDFRNQVVEWFDHFLKEEDNGATDWPTVTYWTERDGGWQVGGGVWRGAERWPGIVAGEEPSDAEKNVSHVESNSDAGERDTAGDSKNASNKEHLSFVVSPTGLSQAESFTEGKVDRKSEFDATVGMRTLQRIGASATTGWDTTEDDNRSLSVQTDPLDHPVEFTGDGIARLHLRATTPDPVVVVRVNDVAPDGTATAVTGGHVRVSHRNGQSGGGLDADEEALVEVPLAPRSHVFECGHCVRLSIASAGFPRTFATPEHGLFRLHSTPDAPSMLTFTGRAHEDTALTFDDTVVMQPPDESVPVVSEHIVASDGASTFARDPTEDTATFSSSGSSQISLPEDVTLQVDHDIEASVAANDPASAYVRNNVDLALDYGTERVNVHTTSRLTHHIALVETMVTIDGQRLFDETWRRMRETTGSGPTDTVNE